MAIRTAQCAAGWDVPLDHGDPGGRVRVAAGAETVDTTRASRGRDLESAFPSAENSNERRSPFTVVLPLRR